MTAVLDLPMRDGNKEDGSLSHVGFESFGSSYEGWKLVFISFPYGLGYSFGSSYEGWKLRTSSLKASPSYVLDLPMRDGNAPITFFFISIDIVLDLPMRDGNTFVRRPSSTSIMFWIFL